MYVFALVFFKFESSADSSLVLQEDEAEVDAQVDETGGFAFRTDLQAPTGGFNFGAPQ